MQRCAHPHVCTLHDDYPLLDGGILMMVLELLPGGSIEDKLKADGRLREFDVTAMAEQILGALGFMHSKDVIHKDIKPGNLMLTQEGGQNKYKLIDFSVASIEASQQKKVTRTLQETTKERAAFVGTPHYMSPEQFTSGVEVTVRTDLWSLGVVMYVCLSGGQLPFAPGEDDWQKISYAVVNTDARPLVELSDVGDVSPGLREIVDRCLSRRGQVQQRVRDGREHEGSATGRSCVRALY